MDASINEFNSDLSSICDWSTRNGLVINSNQSQAIAIGYGNRLLNGNTIQLSEAVLLLVWV